jgi:hypothetical protein
VRPMLLSMASVRKFARILSLLELMSSFLVVCSIGLSGYGKAPAQESFKASVHEKTGKTAAALSTPAFVQSNLGLPTYLSAPFTAAQIAGNLAHRTLATRSDRAAAAPSR